MALLLIKVTRKCSQQVLPIILLDGILMKMLYGLGPKITMLDNLPMMLPVLLWVPTVLEVISSVWTKMELVPLPVVIFHGTKLERLRFLKKFRWHGA